MDGTESANFNRVAKSMTSRERERESESNIILWKWKKAEFNGKEVKGEIGRTLHHPSPHPHPFTPFPNLLR